MLLTIVFTAKAQDLIRFDSEGKVGFKNSTGEIVIPASNLYPEDFPDGLLGIKLNDKFGYIDVTGKTIIPLIYDNGKKFYKETAIVLLDKKMLLIDKTGKIIKKLKYTIIGWSKEDVTNVGLDDKYGRIYNTTGEEIIPPIYDAMPRFRSADFTTWVKLNNKWGTIDKLGNIILPIRYDDIGATLNDNYRVEVNGKYGLMNNSKKLTDVKYDSIGDFKDGFSIVKMSNKFGFIDSLGKELTPITYDYLTSFSEDVATAINNNHWWLLNTKGEKIQLFYNDSLNYRMVDSFREGLCCVKFEDKIGYINKKGNLVIPLLYDEGTRFEDGIAFVGLNNKWGVIDYIRNEIISLEYDEISTLWDGTLEATKGAEKFYFDKKGKKATSPYEK